MGYALPLLALLVAGAYSQEPVTEPAQNSPGQANTRFLGLDKIIGGAIDLFNPCSRCSIQNAQEALRCCNTGENRACCGIFQQGQFPGQFGPQPGPFGPQPGFPGQFGQVGQFQGQFGPPGANGQKPGLCPPLGGQVSSGFGRFGGNQCFAECQSDFTCPGIEKCCQIGCSSICRPPHGAQNTQFIGNQFQAGAQIKRGFCPRTGINALIHGRSGATAGNENPVSEDPTNRELRQQQRKQARQEQKRGIEKRSADRFTERDDRRNRRLNRLNRVRGRVIRSANPMDRDDFRNDRRNRRLNRMNRVRGRVIRQAPAEEPSSDQPNTRFLPGFGTNPFSSIKNPFCREDCRTDNDCPLHLKCCDDELNCRRCVDPVF